MESYSHASAVQSTHQQQHRLSDSAEKPEFSSFSISMVEEQIADTFPLPELKQIQDDIGSYWFSNEYPDPEDLDFKKTIKAISRLPTDLRSRKISIITGEGCLFSCLPELASVCSMVFQVDHDPKLLHLSQMLVTGLATASIGEETRWLNQAITKLREGIVGFDREGDIRTQYSDNKKGMEQYHCFSSEHRLSEVKESCSFCKVIPVYADFYNEDDMVRLACIIGNNNLEVVFINLSNVMEYFQEFYSKNKFREVVTGIDPGYHVKKIPLSESALCAFSSLRVAPLFTRVCNRGKYYDELYSLAQKSSSNVIEQLSERLASKRSAESSTDVCFVLAEIAYPYSLSQASLRLALSHLKYKDALELREQRPNIEAKLKENLCIKGGCAAEFLAIIDTAIFELLP